MWEVGVVVGSFAAGFCRDFPFPASIFLSADRYLQLLLSLCYLGLFYDWAMDTDRQPFTLSSLISLESPVMLTCMSLHDFLSLCGSPVIDCPAGQQTQQVD